MALLRILFVPLQKRPFPLIPPRGLRPAVHQSPARWLAGHSFVHTLRNNVANDSLQLAGCTQLGIGEEERTLLYFVS